MRRLTKITTTLLSVLLFIFAQNGMAQNVAQKNQMYKKRIVRAIDLREKQNKPLYAKNMELTKLLLEAVMNNQITAYANDSLSSTIDIDDLKQKMTIETMDNSTVIDPETMPKEELEAFENSQISYSYGSRDLYQLELTQDWVFDNHRSVVNKENVAITIFIPADHPDNMRGIQVPLATFSFHDCTKIWKNNPNATWFNVSNDAAHLNLSDAFRLELYHSYIVKVSNPNNSYIFDDFPERQSVLESMNQEVHLMEYESNLWEN